jgi:Xaa-Pro aminopeptidase
MTRTFLKGKASEEQEKLYNDVKTVQEKVLEFIKPGVRSKEIYNFTVTEFAKLGHKTGSENGFTHGLGHSLGSEVHEYFPVAGMRSPEDQVIEVGDVLTVEPGLYYKNIGGVRIEDIIYISEGGEVKNLNKFEKVLVIE